MTQNLSALMSVYKNSKPDEVEKCIHSLHAQTVKSDDLVIVIDGEIPTALSDRLSELANAHDEIRLYPIEKNVGLGNALKYGLDNCRHELVARMDTDDIAAPDRFEKQLKCFEDDENLSIVGSNIAEFIGDTDNIISRRNVPSEHAEICDYLKKRCPFNHMAVMFKKSEVLKAGGYIHWHYNEDSYLWVRMYLAGCRFKNIDEDLVFARIDESTFMRRGGYKYYKSERDLFKFMYKNKVIGWLSYQKAKAIRFVVQVLMPNGMRQWFFKKFAREK